MDSTTLIVVIVAAVAVAIIAAAAIMIARRKRSQRLREQYGPEYERAVREAGNEREAESALRDREKRHKKLDLKELDRGQRDDYDRRWREIQAQFVDDPGRAVRGADQLVVEIMKVRGYPVDDFDQRADTLSVDHPETTQRYREARAVARANEKGDADTESLRTAVTSYRALVRALVHGGSGAEHDGPADDRAGDRHAGGQEPGSGRATRSADDQRGDGTVRREVSGRATQHTDNGQRESVPSQKHDTNRETM